MTYDPPIRPKRRWVIECRHKWATDPAWNGDNLKDAKTRAQRYANKTGCTYWVRDRENDGKTVAVLRPTAATEELP